MGDHGRRDKMMEELYVDKYKNLFEKGMSLLSSASDPLSIAEAYAILDTAIGFCTVPVLDVSNNRYVAETAGMSMFSSWGLSVLPVHVVRHVEYERLARSLFFDNYLGLIHANGYRLLGRLDHLCVKDQDGALNYLAFACVMERAGNSFAAASIDWLLKDKSTQFPRSRQECFFEYCAAINGGNQDRAVLFGTYLNNRTAENLLIKQSASACIIARVLNEGTRLVPKNIAESEVYYTKALQLDPRSLAAYNNLGMLYARGGEGVEGSLPQAIAHFRTAIELGDVSHAPRNLASVLCRSDAGKYKDYAEAIELLAMQATRGGEEGSKRALATLRLLARSTKIKCFLITHPSTKQTLREVLGEPVTPAGTPAGTPSGSGTPRSSLRLPFRRTPGENTGKRGSSRSGKLDRSRKNETSVTSPIAIEMLRPTVSGTL